MRKHFVLRVNTVRGVFDLESTLEKSFDEKESFKLGFNGQPVKWIRVVPIDKDLEKITSPDEIERVVQYDELQSLYEVEKKGGEYVVVDKDSLKNAFPAGPTIQVLRVVPQDAIPFYTLQGAHYHLNVKLIKSGKKKLPHAQSQELYGLIYTGLVREREVLIVKYSPMNGVKYGVVYATPTGLMLSHFIPTPLQRDRKESQAIQTKLSSTVYERLLGDLRTGDLGEFEDEYGAMMRELIDSAVQGRVIEAKGEIEIQSSSLSALMDDVPAPPRPSKTVSPPRSRLASLEEEGVTVPISPPQQKQVSPPQQKQVSPPFTFKLKLPVRKIVEEEEEEEEKVVPNEEEEEEKIPQKIPGKLYVYVSHDRQSQSSLKTLKSVLDKKGAVMVTCNSARVRFDEFDKVIVLLSPEYIGAEKFSPAYTEFMRVKTEVRNPKFVFIKDRECPFPVPAPHTIQNCL